MCYKLETCFTSVPEDDGYLIRSDARNAKITNNSINTHRYGLTFRLYVRLIVLDNCLSILDETIFFHSK